MGFDLGGLISGALGFLGGERTNSANAAIAQKQMDFQERMSNTSYQRAVNDMQAAGLNPMLAYMQGGASAPQGSSYQAVDSVNSGVSGYQNSIARDIMRKELELISEKVNTQRAETRRVLAIAGNDEPRVPFAGQRAATEVQDLSSRVTLTWKQIDEIEQRIKLGSYSAGQLAALTDQLRAQTHNLNLDSSEKEQMAALWRRLGEEGAAAKTLMPILLMIKQLIGR